jgi:hypothetical protein
MPRTATVGPEIFQRTNELTKDGKMGRTEAFAKIAQERKMQAGTVAANYYRVARNLGQGGKRRKDVAAGAAAEKGIYSAQRGRRNGQRTASDGDLGALAKQIAGLTTELVRRVEERDKAIRQILG